ncbi:MAG: hypothetical protein ACPGN3_16155 [Opitutales bacterium]
MFKRIILEEWHSILPIAGFVVTAGTFLVLAIRALLMQRSELNALAEIPLKAETMVKEEDAR